MTSKTPLVLALLGLSLVLSACGRRAGLDTPVSYEQAMPGTAEAQAAANPPRDADGKPLPVPTKPRQTPYARSFPLDPLLN